MFIIRGERLVLGGRDYTILYPFSLFWHFTWHIFWHSFFTWKSVCLAVYLTFYPAFYLTYSLTFYLAVQPASLIFCSGKTQRAGDLTILFGSGEPQRAHGQACDSAQVQQARKAEPALVFRSGQLKKIGELAGSRGSWQVMEWGVRSEFPLMPEAYLPS